ncbi:glyoxylate/hydroxypyruvate reductase HPR3 isoform X1 [Lathyrus oleraceus]|uniref:glyoxylate/hydroxypyruvate reductase HPR3 isoform X1 n=1 Tax=Pisum sativum TaxID=3888 RepID=UPI0021CEF86A|nr:glyoxylate/hydroxypyruvate reductase HPR3 isoform X1 [Pisum sativum]
MAANQNVKTSTTSSSIQQSQNILPNIFIHGPPKFSIFLQPNPSHNFHILNPSCLPPLHQFIATNPHHASSIHAILCTTLFPVNAEVLDLLPSLRLVCASTAGINHIDLAECKRRGIHVTDAGNTFSEDVADMAVGLLIDVSRKISVADSFLRRKLQHASWDFPLGSKLTGKKIGVVGMGRIGSEVATRLEAFSCKISYNSRNKKSSISYPFYSSVLELATNTNVLILCCALNDETRHIVNKQVMLALGKGGIIVNVGRGGLIDEKELLRCLIEGEIGGAGLDVFENEPHVPKELFSLDNVVLSPHAAVLTSESFNGISKVVEENLKAFFSNKPLITPVL